MTAPHGFRRLYRLPHNRLLAGVASGIAEHLGLPVPAVRIAFVGLAVLNGLGALLYAVFWAVLPAAPGRRRGRRDGLQLAAFLALGIGVVVLALQAGQGLRSTFGWLVAVVALGVGIIWHQSDPKRRVRLLERDRRAYLLQFVGGGVLVVVGIIGTLVVFSPITRTSFATLLYGLLFALVALGGVDLALAPLLWRMFSQLRAERVGRIREQERAEVAAMIHDQVLHTLALIQRNPTDVNSVLRLARGQERTLRNWLYHPTASPDERFGAALEEAAAEVEATYPIVVETVVVGDRGVDEQVRALVAATREALVNAARHAGVGTVSLYAEVETGQVDVFVRDRGVGFDPSTVDDNRHGVSGSIIGRMRRHGGGAEITSAVGTGTEIRLTMPVTAEPPAPAGNVAAGSAAAGGVVAGRAGDAATPAEPSEEVRVR